MQHSHTIATRHSVDLLTQVLPAFFLSGVSALLLEVVYVRLLRYWTGNTAHAVAAVLCAYMAGLTVGSFAAGKYFVRRRRLLVLFGTMEFVVGWYSLGLPWLLKQLEPAYVGLTSFLGPDTKLALLGHFSMGMAVLALPTLLMGATFPILVRAASQAPEDRVEVAGKLYSANLVGAAFGVLLGDFLFIRFLGLGNTLVLVALLNTLVATWCMFLERLEPTKAWEEGIPPTVRPASASSSAVVLLAAFGGGLLVLFIEIVWTHMVGRFLDSSVYGFAVTLFAVIAGLGAGAAIAARSLVSKSAADLVPHAFLGAGLAVTLLIPLWDHSRLLAEKYPVWCVGFAIILIGAVVLSADSRLKTVGWYVSVTLGLALAILGRRWLDREGGEFFVGHSVDFAVSVLFMAGPAVLMGTIFPLVLQWHLDEMRRPPQTVAKVYGVNTLGCLAGILAATFLALPSLGVERSGRVVGLGFVALGVLLVLHRRTRRRWVVVLIAVPALAWARYAPTWNFTNTLRLLDHAGTVLYSGEDINSGITTVLQNEDERNIYVNDLFNGGTNQEEQEQARLALVPLLYTREFDRAMVIGVGTGETAGILGEFPFKTMDLVDFSSRVTEAAERFFSSINFDIFKDPRVRAHTADGRHFMLTHPDKLSLVTIEVSRIWIAGEGDLYTREFYEICSARLSEQGILQQWVPLFSLSAEETLIILRTVRQVFPYLTLYLGGESGMLVASRSPLQLSYSRLNQIDANPRLAAILQRLELPRASSLLGDLALDSKGLDALLARAPEKKISTDLCPYLEHSNARYHNGRTSTRPLWHFLLTAQDFRLPPVEGASPEAMLEIRARAAAQRRRQFESLPYH